MEPGADQQLPVHATCDELWRTPATNRNNNRDRLECVLISFHCTKNLVFLVELGGAVNEEEVFGATEVDDERVVGEPTQRLNRAHVGDCL